MAKIKYTNREIAEIYDRNYMTVYRICFMYMKNKPDAEDMTQNSFLRLISSRTALESAEHERAWLIRTAVNLCKNSLKSVWNRTAGFDEALDSGYSTFIPDPDETLKKLLALPPKQKTAMYLYYYEGYSTEEIAGLMSKPASTVRGYLHRGRNSLKKVLESETEEIFNGTY